MRRGPRPRPLPWLGMLLTAALAGGPRVAAAADTAAASNASNGSQATHVTVNERTGGVSVQLTLFSVPGVVPGMGAELVLTYQSDQAVAGDTASTSVFGLPTGWGLSLAYVVPADNVDGGDTLHVDADASYPIDSDWTTEFTATGASTATPVKTGLQLRNLVDTRYQADAATVTVNGIPSAWAVTRLDGTVRYLSANGLELAEVDRFGNALQLHYAGDTNAANAELTAIVDTWGNTISVDSCTSGDGCTLGTVTFTLPDGRTVAYVAPGDGVLSEYVDPYGNVTHFLWGDNPCAAGPTNVLTGLTTPMGGFTGLEYTCLNVCTATSTVSCLQDGNYTTWPVVQYATDCPSAASGSVCTPTSSSDNQVTLYDFGSGETPNYTGFPLYSPYDSADADTDALMASNDTSFSYSTTQTRLENASTEVLRIERQYDFLHLLEEETQSVLAESSSGGDAFTTSKQVSYCYPGGSGESCTLGADVTYTELPANYETPVGIGSCVYQVGPTADGSARRSTMTREYDGFGNLVHEATWHGSSTTGVTAACAGSNGRLNRLATSGLSLVLDEYRAWDTPSAVDTDGYLSLGAGHYGLPTGQLSFAYLEDADGTVSSTPARVALACQTLGSGGTVVETTALGALGTATAAPTTAGVLDACTSPAWDTSVEAPRATTYGHDTNGRVTSRATGWADGTSGAGTLTSVSATTTYALGSSEAGEESCAQVLEATDTDAAGDATVLRQCTLNGFTLSLTDALGNQTTYTHDAAGLATAVTYPNGTSIQYSFYQACPVAQDGATATCPATSTALGSCPYDTAGRSCQVETLDAGTDPSTGAANTSVADGVARITVMDGLGRAVTSMDTLGGTSGSGYTTLETRKTRTYDSLGLVTTSTEQMGATDPLVYTTTTTYDPKRRPETVCGPRGVAQQFVHDDVAQQSRQLVNGQGQQATTVDDNQKLTELVDCPVTSGLATESSGACPTLASDTSDATCSGYTSTITRDGGGTAYTTTASDSTPDSGASLESMAGTATYSAGLLQTAYTTTALAADGSTSTTGTLSRSFDLLGSVLSTTGSITTSDGTSSAFASDTYVYDALGRLMSATTPLGLSETRTYTARDELATRTTTGGDTYALYYDSMQRLVRRCYPAASGGGTEGETLTRDALTGQVTQITKFTNPSACTACTSGDCGDVSGDWVAMDYTPFSAITAMAWSDGTRLEWAYDQYHRQTCFADAVATALGGSCPTSPTDSDWTPEAGSLVTWFTYWDDDDPYRRGLLESTCRGVTSTDGGTTVECQDTDYYTSADTGGSCDDTLSTVVGAFAGQVKTQTQCTGGSCATGAGTAVLTTTTTYDAYRRPCSVTTTNAAGATVLASTYTYDQYDQVVSETHASAVDTSDDSNYTTTYTYDGLLRLTQAAREYASGAATDTTTYTYDARGNPTTKTETTTAGSAATTLDAAFKRWPIARKRNGRPKRRRLRVTLFGSAAVDLAGLDLDSLRLDGHRPRGIRRLRDRNRDGFRDRKLVFRTRDLPDGVQPTVTGRLTDGTPIFASLGDADTTTTTTYTYDTDGALTAVTTTPSGGDATTTYLVWDDFTPSTSDPSTGTTSAGNGTLVGWGSSPDALTTTLTFDPRQRLTGVAGTDDTVTYGFDARSYLASATTESGDELQLYHGPGSLPRVANAFRTADGTTQVSSWVGPLRHVDALAGSTLTASSGGYVLRPRKDVAGVYDPTAGTLTAYQYDPYGAESDDDTSASYDLDDDPWRFAGEFRDATWGGYYLRERWYLPEFQTFTSRDPEPSLSRYGYAGGNPLGRVDPSGRSWSSFVSGFTKGIDDFLSDLDVGDSGTKGILGALSSILLAPIIGPAQILADPSQFWKGKDFWLNDLSLAVGVASEAAGAGLIPAESFWIPWQHALVDSAVGLGVTALSSVRISKSGTWSLNGKAALQGLENTVGGLLWAREGVAFGYDPYDVKVESAFRSAEQTLQPGEMALYRFRESLEPSGKTVPTWFDKRAGWTTPLLEGMDLGVYHEGVLAIVRRADGGFGWLTSENLQKLVRESDSHQVGKIPRAIAGRTLRLDEVGTFDYDESVAEMLLLSNPLKLKSTDQYAALHAGEQEYHLLRRNCHHHAQAMVKLFQ